MFGLPSAEKSGFQMKANPFATEFSGNAGSGVPSVKILIARIIAKIKSNFCDPPYTYGCMHLRASE